MKKFLLLIGAFRAVVVEAKDELAAHREIGDHYPEDGWTLDETQVDRELTSEDEVSQAIADGAVLLRDWFGTPPAK